MEEKHRGLVMVKASVSTGHLNVLGQDGAECSLELTNRR